MVDDLWNKPAFVLDILLKEMVKLEGKRLEWLVWVDRDTLILDQCRPSSSFLPPTVPTGMARWWRRNEKARSQIRSNVEQGATGVPRSEDPNKPLAEVNLLVTNDLNGLNNGIFLLRVSPWSVSLFTAILAFRHYNPTLELKFTEQSAMELVLKDDRFKDQVQFVPQHWFNAYSHGGPEDFATRNEIEDEGMEDVYARRGDWLIHFAGNEHKDKALNEWADMLEIVKDVWREGRVQRDVSEAIRIFWEGKGF
ncbi:hypothetical protein N0V94_001077 [Neodidymelliopsis sp. IMI 364377]|nr:hypothetical protein N0V94_001077 [Neodidymelliopsis sp. IMI 364377]